MNVLIAIAVSAVFLGAFVGLPRFAAWDRQRQGQRVAPKLLVLFAGFVVFCSVVDVVTITAVGTKMTTTFQTISPPTPAPPQEKAGEDRPGKE